MRRNTTFGRKKPSESSGNGFTVNGDLLVDDGTSTEVLRIQGDTFSGVTPPRGIVCRDTQVYAWGQYTVDTTANTATLNGEFNVASATYVTDSAVDIAFRNASSAALMPVAAMLRTRTNFVYLTSPATTGFRLNLDSAPVGNYNVYFVVVGRDLT